MSKLIKEMTESIEFKLKDIERYTKMINLAATKDVKGIRKFIYENDTHEKEMFYEYLKYGDVELFHKVYPSAHEHKGDYVVSIINEQYLVDHKELNTKFWVFTKEEEGYPEDYSDGEYPDHIDEDSPAAVAQMYM